MRIKWDRQASRIYCGALDKEFGLYSENIEKLLKDFNQGSDVV